ncbi:MAG: tetratricopeptide repeat protein [Flavobacteriaceae bacterium]|nr:tetratricopeptide repeat protein [Flavobacteriaceae bacterium]
MKRYLIYSLIFIVSCQLTWANTDLFNKGNDAYADGNYREAARLYKQIVDEGQVSAELFYNLGNTYYKQQKIAESIYYYELALLLSPNHQSAINNLKFAENKKIDEIEVLESSEFELQKENIIFAFDQDQWAIFAILGSICTLLFFVLFLFIKKTAVKRLTLSFSVVCLLLALGFFWIANQQVKAIDSKRYAIVFAEEVELLNEPNQRSSKSFTLHEGTKVKIEEEFRDFTKVRIANDNTAWIPSSKIKELKL